MQHILSCARALARAEVTHQAARSIPSLATRRFCSSAVGKVPLQEEQYKPHYYGAGGDGRGALAPIDPRTARQYLHDRIARLREMQVLDDIARMPEEGADQVAAKWGALQREVLLDAVELLQGYGYPPTQEAITFLNDRIYRMSVEDPELRELLALRFTAMVERVFKVAPLDMPPADVVKIFNEVADMFEEDEEFVAAVDKIVAEPKATNFAQRRAAVMPHIVGLQMRVLERYGYPGTQGWLTLMHQTQSAIKDTDALVALERAIEKQNNLFEKLSRTAAPVLRD